MKKLVGAILVIGLVTVALTMQAQAGWVDRLSVDFLAFPGEFFTSSAIPGIAIFTKTLVTPDETLVDPHPGTYPGTSGPVAQVMNIKVSATGDNHDGRRSLLGCFINGSPCHPGTTNAGGPAGWVAVQKLPFGVTPTNCNDGGGGTTDCHDNNIHYEWCVPPGQFNVDSGFGGGFNTVQIRLAAFPAGGFVFVEAVQVEIDTSTIEALTPGGNINPCSSFVPSSPLGPGHGH